MKSKNKKNFFIASITIVYIISVLFLIAFNEFNQFIIRILVPFTFVILSVTKFNHNFKSIPKEYYIYLCFILWANFGIINVVFDIETFYSYVLNLLGISMAIFTIYLLASDINTSKYIHTGLFINATIALIDGIVFTKDGYYSDGRLGGIYGNSNTFSFILLTGIFSIYIYRTFIIRKWEKKYLLLIELFLIYGVILAASRKTLLIVILFYILYYINNYTSSRFLFSSIVIFTFTVLSFSIDLDNILQNENLTEKYTIISRFEIENVLEYDTLTRWELISDGFTIISKFPIIGGGLGNYKYYTSRGAYAHNDLMEIVATTGIIGLLIYLLIFVILIRKTRYLAKNYVLNNFTSLIFIILTLLFIIGMGMPHFIEWHSMIFICSLIIFIQLKYKVRKNI